MSYAAIAARAAALILRKGALITIGGRSVKAARILDEHHFVETGGLNSAFGAAKISNGDFKYVMEGGANPVPGEQIVDARGMTTIVAWTEALAPADVVCAWIVWARNG